MNKHFFKWGIVAIAIVLIIRPISAQDYNLYFDFNSDVIRMNDVMKLHLLKQQFNPDMHRIHLVGHTDTVGNYSYNLELSNRRTTAVQDYLTHLGIESEFISKDYKGKLQPVASDQFYNRRVELFLSTRTEDIPIPITRVNQPNQVIDGKNVSIPNEEPNLMVKPLEPQTFEEFTEMLKPQVQEFTIPVAQAIELEGNRGTIINIPENAFVTSSGKPITGEATVQLTEYYNMDEYYSEKLPTVSGGNLLTSAGVVNIEVFQRKEKLKLKEGTDIQLAFPKTNELPYYTFYGDRQPDGSMNWNSDKRQLTSNQQLDYGDIAATIDTSGTLIISDTATARKRNKNIRYNPVTEKFNELNSTELLEEKLEEERLEQQIETAQRFREEQRKQQVLREKKIAEQRKQAMATQQKINEHRKAYYNDVKANMLGYINCDDFIRSLPVSEVNYILELDNPDVLLVSAILIFRKSNGYLDFKIHEGKFAQLNNRVPLVSKPELLVVGMKDNKPFYYFTNVTLTKKKRHGVTLKETSFQKVKEILKG